MSGRKSSGEIIFEDGMFIVEQSAECAIPGYLILRLKGPERSLAELAPQTAKALGEILARTAAAIERAVKPERVYVLSFCEVDPRLHFHLFPRSAWLLGEYGKAHHGAAAPVDGPALFVWARDAYAPGSCAAEAKPGLEVACEALRRLMK